MDTWLSLLIPAVILVGTSIAFSLIYFIAEFSDRRVSSSLIARRSSYFLLCQLILGLLTTAVGTLAFGARLVLSDTLEDLRLSSASAIGLSSIVAFRLTISQFDYLRHRLGVDGVRRHAGPGGTPLHAPQSKVASIVRLMRWSYSGLDGIMDRTYTTESIRASSLDRRRRRYASILIRELGQDAAPTLQKMAINLCRLEKRQIRTRLSKKITLAISANPANDLAAVHQILQILIDSGYGQEFTPRKAHTLVRNYRTESRHFRRPGY